jgi:hypothetical protein
MKKLLILSLVALCANLSFAQTKYVDRVLAESEVTVTKNVLYASNYTVLLGGPPFTLEPLYMDVYAPNDGVTSRPLVIYTHTGSFLPRYINQTPTGARDDSATVAICKDLARRGYVVASISYRLGWNPQGATESIRKNTIINAAYKGVQDISAAIRFFKQSADIGGNPYGIDPSKIVLGGQGTGGYIVSAFASLDRQSEIKIDKFRDPNTGVAYVNDTIWGDRHGLGGYPGFGNESNTGYTTDAQIGFCIGGALGDSGWLEKGEMPLIWVHSMLDPFAPYTTGMVNVPGTTLQVVEVSGGYDVMKRVNDFGNNAAYKGKVMDDYTRQANLLNDGLDGLYPIAGLVNASGPYEWWDTNAIKMLPSPPYNPTVILASGKATNPFMSKARAMTFIDSICGYIAPRLAVTLGYVNSVGINPAELSSNVTLSPNPAQDRVVIQSNWTNNNLNGAVVRDLNGRTLARLTAENNRIDQSIDLPTGIYLVELQFDFGTGTKKLIIE